MATITVPKTESEVNGFIKSVNDEAFAAEKPIIFEGDHTAAMRILCEIAPINLRRASGGVFTVNAAITESGAEFYVDGSKTSGRREFKKSSGASWSPASARFSTAGAYCTPKSPRRSRAT